MRDHGQKTELLFGTGKGDVRRIACLHRHNAKKGGGIMDIKTIQGFKKLSNQEKLTYILGEADTKAVQLIAMWLAELAKKVEK